MAKHILKCPQCRIYTLKNLCSSCGVATSQIKPPKYSPEDPYGDYRRKAKYPDLVAQGLL
ncbi:nucleolar RNA-binding Nop10p family protein [Candidatus Woesearchaeota archaeon]|nr:nucleolar RNA-binding Nop10p family protein [Candidatus Woesearchaeota archaeon]